MRRRSTACPASASTPIRRRRRSCRRPAASPAAGPVLVLDPAQNNTFKAINRAWKLGATVQASAGASGAPIRYSLRGLSDAAQDDLVQSLALQAERAESAPGRAMRQPRIGLYPAVDRQHGRRLDALGARAVRLRVRRDSSRKTSSRRSTQKDRRPHHGRRCAGAGGGGGGGPRRRVDGGGAAVRPEYAYQLTAGDLQGFEQFVRGGGTVVCLSNASTFAIQQFKLPVQERRRRPAAGRVLPARIDRRSHDRSDASGDGRHAGQGRRVRRRQPGLRDAGRLQGHGARALSGVGIAAAVRVPHRREISAGQGRRRSTSSSMRVTSCCSASGRSGAASRSARSGCCSTRRCSGR